MTAWTKFVTVPTGCFMWWFQMVGFSDDCAVLRVKSIFLLGCALLLCLSWSGVSSAENPILVWDRSGEPVQADYPDDAGSRLERSSDLESDPRRLDFVSRYYDEPLDDDLQSVDYEARFDRSPQAGDVSTSRSDPLTTDSGGVIEGTLKGDDGAVVQATWVNLYDSAASRIASTRVDENGFFSFSGLPAGEYRMWIDPDADYLQRVYGGLDCVGSCRVEDGDPIDLESDETKQLDITLTRGLSFTVNVAEQGTPATPIQEACFDLFTDTGEFVNWRCRHSENGTFRLPAVLPGDYKLIMTPVGAFDSFPPVLYPDIPCVFQCSVSDQGTPIEVTAQAIADGEPLELDIAVEPGGTLSGLLQDAEGGNLDGSMELLGSNGEWGSRGYRIEGGEFSIDGIPPGTYKLGFRADGFVNQLYEGVSCPDFNCDRASLGQTIEISAGETTQLEPVTMVQGSTIEGFLTGDDGGVVQSTWVSLYDPVGNWVAARRVDENGFYRFAGMVEGEYRMRIDPDSDYVQRLYESTDCVQRCRPEDGDPIFLDQGETKEISLQLTRGLNISIDAFDRDDPAVSIDALCIDLFSVDGQFLNSRCRDANTTRNDLPAVLPGQYKVQINPINEWSRYAITLYDGASGTTCLPSCNIGEQGAVVEMIDSDRELSIPAESVNLMRGRVTNAAGDGLREMWVNARPVDDPNQSLYLGWVSAEEDGNYEFRVPQGEFYFQFQPWPEGSSKRYLPALFPDVPCTLFGCDRSAAQSFSITNGDIEVNPVLNLGARVTGSVARESDREPINSRVWLLTPAESPDRAAGRVVEQGSFEFAALPPGEYRMGAESRETDPVLIDQLFEDRNCVGARGTRCFYQQAGDVLTLAPGDDKQIDFALDIAPTQTVTGRVLERSTGQPLAGARIDMILNDVRVPLRTIETDPDGRFNVVLPIGDWGVVIEKDGYITRLFSSFRSAEGWCSARRCPDFPGQRVSVGDEPVDLGDLPMDPGALVTGTVSLPEGAPVGSNEFVTGRVFDEDGQPVDSLQIRVMPWYAQDPEGFFAVQVPPGTWHLLFQASSSNRALVATALDDVSCPNGSCGMETTGSVQVSQNEVLTPADEPQLDVTLSDGVPLMGTLLDGDNGGAPVDFGRLHIYNDQGVLAGQVFAFGSQNGIFQTQYGLPNGTYYVSTRLVDPEGGGGSGVSAEFVDVVYDDVPCVADCDVTTGTPIEVDLQAETLPPPIDIELFRGLSISGSVRQADGGAPVSGRIDVFDDSGGSVPGTFVSQEDGSFTVGGLLPGDYYLRTRNTAGLEDQLWNGDTPILCEPSCSPVSGTPVTVTSGDSVEGIDFVLTGAGSISGTTTGRDAVPLGAIMVEVYNALGGLVGSSLSDQDGAWRVDSLPAGQFYVRTDNDLGLVNVAWDGRECTGCDVTQTTAIELSRGEARADINLALDTGAALTGTVTRQADATPVAGVNVEIYSAAGDLLKSHRTGSNGTWQVDGLGEGSYRIATRNSLGLVNQVHAGVECVAECDIGDGTVVSLTIGESETINFALESAASIAGTVLDADNAPIADVAVQAVLADGRLARQGRTRADGSYEIRGLAPGEVFLRTRADGNYTDQTYNGRDCIPVCDVTGSDAVTVSAGQRIDGIDFSLTFGGGLAGSVTTSDAVPVSSLSVEIYNALGHIVGMRDTDENGDFVLRGLSGGRYFARTRNSRGLIDQVFDGLGCTPLPCVTGLGTPLELDGGLIEGVDFTLAAGNSLSGTVTDQFGNPLPTGEVVLYDETGREVKRGIITDGEWRLTGIADGSYYAVVLNGSGLIDELYDRLPCPGGRCDITQGTAIPVPQLDAAETDSSGRTAGSGPLVFELQRGSRIRGVLQGPDNTPLVNATVYFFNNTGEVVGSSQTDGIGEFVSEAAFSEGNYYLATSDGETRGVTTGGYVNVAYQDLPCPLECDVTEGVAVELDGQFDRDDIVLRVLEGGALQGRAVDGQDAGLVGAQVEIFDQQGRLAGLATVGTSGDWRIDGLPDGIYTVVLRNDLVEAFGDYVVGSGFCDGDCDPSVGTVFTISGGEPESDVDIILARDEVIFQSRFQAD
ncbi:carboxypeptidase-like regulatory domain-containing protein [Wenzhouxiangella limi]|uniref:Carboxypeptidase regulatory-like domain-containing protein n=1 Tax=Wenzhouxiangella limi TaxID=2707351 RepID=A0A845V7Z4_9GAMM|nr:carboxypeptidase-like regulatory domain-containing protein [Wenzhouxiangella limi]NDY96301.1 carboxypeptidase regulatory-like domain-containing protein [Wenzhouxiangella limi]